MCSNLMRSIAIFGTPNHIWARMLSIDTEPPLLLIAMATDCI